MTPARFIIRELAPSDRAAYSDMWSHYNAFYETTLAEHVTSITWERLLEAGAMRALVAEGTEAGTLLGFANYVIHPYTWSDRQACYLEDLFVRPEVRGAGIGRALIERVASLAIPAGFDRLYWMTREGNVTARRLYDRIGERDDFIRYQMPVGGVAATGDDTLEH